MGHAISCEYGLAFGHGAEVDRRREIIFGEKMWLRSKIGLSG